MTVADQGDPQNAADVPSGGTRLARSLPTPRDDSGPRDSPFRRHWTWRDRVFVWLAGWAIASTLRLIYLTLRVRCEYPADVLGARARGARVVWATWHDGIMLLPLMVTRILPLLRPRVARANA